MTRTFTAFRDDRQIAHGPLTEVIRAISPNQSLVFDDQTGDLMKLSNADEIATALNATAPAAPEVGLKPVSVNLALLPRHLAWLESQPGGPSAAMRRLIDQARKAGEGRDRQAREACYRFISMVAGDRKGFEAATRALFAGDAAQFDIAAQTWPADIRAYGHRLAQPGMRA